MHILTRYLKKLKRKNKLNQLTNERGEWYRPSAETENDAKFKAVRWAIAESKGKYLSSGGIIYNSEKEYLQQQDILLNN